MKPELPSTNASKLYEVLDPRITSLHAPIGIHSDDEDNRVICPFHHENYKTCSRISGFKCSP